MDTTTGRGEGLARPSGGAHRLRAELLARYGTARIPRYTSYPSADLFPKLCDEGAARRVLGQARERPLSLYVHVPFCKKLCWYCGCNMRITKDRALVERYLDAVTKEAAQVAALVERPGPVVQLHLGGGTPTHLDPAQLTRLMGALRAAFPFARELEASIEVHPPVTTREQISTLAALGFNRVSMGVQDFDPEVQTAIHRHQPFEQTRDLIESCRRAGFVSVNVDLMYGLPLQTPERFDATLDRVQALRPDRVALFGYAHVPTLKPHQKLLERSGLPDAPTRLALLERAIERLVDAGYVYIGLDHFALPDDELVRARRDGTLRRSCMGYTTCAETEVLAFGPSSISEIDGAFLQNERDVAPYCERIERGELPVVRAYLPTREDQLRRRLIQTLFCQLGIDTDAFGRREGVDFASHFTAELKALEPLEADGLVRWEGPLLRVTPMGQLLLRNVAAVFDAYLAGKRGGRHAAAV